MNGFPLFVKLILTHLIFSPQTVFTVANIGMLLRMAFKVESAQTMLHNKVIKLLVMIKTVGQYRCFKGTVWLIANTTIFQVFCYHSSPPPPLPHSLFSGFRRWPPTLNSELWSAWGFCLLKGTFSMPLWPRWLLLVETIAYKSMV